MTEFPPIGSLVVHDDSSPALMPGKRLHDGRVGQVLEHREGGLQMSWGMSGPKVRVYVLNPHPDVAPFFDPWWELEDISVVVPALPVPAVGLAAAIADEAWLLDYLATHPAPNWFT
jgi:hypothetical protein